MDLKLNVDIINFINFLEEISKNLFFSLNKFNIKKIIRVKIIVFLFEKIGFFELIKLIM